MFSPIFAISARRVSSIDWPLVERRCEQRLDIRRALRQRRLRDLGGELLEVLLARDEIGLAVHLDDRRAAAVGRSARSR